MVLGDDSRHLGGGFDQVGAVGLVGYGGLEAPDCRLSLLKANWLAAKSA